MLVTTFLLSPEDPSLSGLNERNRFNKIHCPVGHTGGWHLPVSSKCWGYRLVFFWVLVSDPLGLYQHGLPVKSWGEGNPSVQWVVAQATADGAATRDPLPGWEQRSGDTGAGRCFCMYLGGFNSLPYQPLPISLTNTILVTST